MTLRLLTPILPSAGGFSTGALLSSLRVLLLHEPRWLHAWAALILLGLPFVVVAGALFGLLAGREAGPRLGWSAFLLGLLMAWVQEAAALTLPKATAYSVGLAGILLSFAALLVYARGSRGAPAWGRRLAAASGLLLLALPAGFLLPPQLPSLGAVPAGADSRPKPEPTAPNLMLVVLDTLRADRLGCYGYGRPTSPQLDALAARGRLFLHAQATATHTSASHATLFTGLLPSEHGVASPLVGLPLEPATLAGALADAGWNTAGVTSNFVVRRQSGFGRGYHLYDDTLVVPAGMPSAVAWAASFTGVGRVLGRVPLVGGHGWNAMIRSRLRERANLHAEATHERAELALESLDSAGRPYFLFVNYMDMHAPYDPPAEDRAEWLRGQTTLFPSGLDTIVFTERLAALERRVQAGEEEAAELAALSDLYDGELAHLDSQLPRLWEQFFARSRAAGRPALLIVTADHGEMFAEHGYMTHAQQLYEECLRVPLIVAGDGIEPGMVEETVSLLDVPGTLLAAAGLPAIGRSRDLLADSVRPPGHVIAEDGRALTVAHFDRLQAVAFYHGRSKGVFELDEEQRQFLLRESFDLAADPTERTPLGLDLLRGLLDWQAAWWERYLAGRAKFTGGGLSAGDRDALAALGYVEGAAR